MGQRRRGRGRTGWAETAKWWANRTYYDGEAGTVSAQQKEEGARAKDRPGLAGIRKDHGTVTRKVTEVMAVDAVRSAHAGHETGPRTHPERYVQMWNEGLAAGRGSGVFAHGAPDGKEALDVDEIGRAVRADPILRLFGRYDGLETGEAVRERGGREVRLDRQEREHLGGELAPAMNESVAKVAFALHMQGELRRWRGRPERRGGRCCGRASR